VKKIGLILSGLLLVGSFNSILFAGTSMQISSNKKIHATDVKCDGDCPVPVPDDTPSDHGDPDAGDSSGGDSY